MLSLLSYILCHKFAPKRHLRATFSPNINSVISRLSNEFWPISALLYDRFPVLKWCNQKLGRGVFLNSNYSGWYHSVSFVQTKTCYVNVLHTCYMLISNKVPIITVVHVLSREKKVNNWSCFLIESVLSNFRALKPSERPLSPYEYLILWC